MPWKDYVPVVGRRCLLLLAGITWMAVGIMLVVFAYSWLSPLAWTSALPLAIAGLLIAAVAYQFGFVALARRNIQRIHNLPDRAYIFAFQATKGYLMIVAMATSGSLLRHSPFPKPDLAVIYLAMGGTLFLASLLYYRQVWPTV